MDDCVQNDRVRIDIEPLPDPAALRLRHHREPDNSSSNNNATQLRPKIALISHDKVDSDDEGEAMTDDKLLLQERVKLEKILCKLYSRCAKCMHMLLSFCCLHDF